MRIMQKIQIVMFALLVALVGSIWLGNAQAKTWNSTANVTVSEPPSIVELAQESNSTVPAQPTSETPSTSGENTENPSPARDDEPHTTPSSQETPTTTETPSTPETPATPQTPSQKAMSDQQFSKAANEISLFALAGIIALGGALVLHKMTRGLS